MFFKLSHLSLCVALAATTGLVACGSGDNNSRRVEQTVHAAQYEFVSVALQENSGYVHFKGFYQFELIGLQKDGTTVNLTHKATWKLSDSRFGTIKRGLFTASGEVGDVTLTVEYDGFPVISQSVNISDAQLTRIDVSHPVGNVDECLTTEFSADTQFSNGITLPYPLKWYVTEGNDKARFADENSPRLSAINSGRISVVAEGVDNDGNPVRSQPLPFDINEALTAIELSVDRTQLNNGESTMVSAIGRYGVTGKSATISDTITLSTDSDLLSIDKLRITAQNARGSQSNAVLIATCGGIEATREITVKQQPIKRIEIVASNTSTTSSANSSGSSGSSSSSAAFTIKPGDRLDFDLKAVFSDDSVANNYTYGIRWSVDKNGANLNDSDIEISSSGELRIDDDISHNGNTTIFVIAELRDENNKLIQSQSGSDLKVQVRVSIVY